MRILAIIIAFVPSLLIAECFPSGEYKYIFSDGNESYFYNGDYTLRKDSSGTLIGKEGDFKVSLGPVTSQRSHNTFIFRTAEGTYSKELEQPIYFEARGELSQIINMLADGSNYKGEFGTYSKKGGKVIFEPSIKLANISVSVQNCAKIKFGTSNGDQEILPEQKVVSKAPTAKEVDLKGKSLNGSYMLSIANGEGDTESHQDVSQVVIYPEKNLSQLDDMISYQGRVDFVDSDGEKHSKNGFVSLIK